MKSISISISLLCLFLSACGAIPGATPTPRIIAVTGTPTVLDRWEPAPTATATAVPRIIAHPSPALPPVRREAFIEAGCSGEGRDFWQGLLCGDESPVRRLGCQVVDNDEFYGGLEPAYPVMRCQAYRENVPPEDSIKHFTIGGCSGHVTYRSHVIFKDNQFLLANGDEEFQPLFAPITSAVEALSYALVNTNLTPRYEEDTSFSQWQGLTYLTEEIEFTHVRETSDGYIVHLFQDGPGCDCMSPYTAYTVDLLVTREGDVIRMVPKPIYELNVCFDY